MTTHAADLSSVFPPHPITTGTRSSASPESRLSGTSRNYKHATHGELRAIELKMPVWQQRTSVWRKVTSPARGAKRLRNEFASVAVPVRLLPEDDFTEP
jgi:hypothetical protein